MAVGRRGTRWQLTWTTERGGGISGGAPVLGPGTGLSSVELVPPASADAAGWLVVLAPPGTTEISFVSCAAGGARRSAVAGDTAVIPVKPRALEGTIELRTPAGRVTLGPPQSYSGSSGSYPVHPLPLPAGHREVSGVTGDGRASTYAGTQTVRDVRVIVRCWAPGDGVRMAVGPPVQVRCDGTPHVAADGVTLRPGTRLVDVGRALQVEVLLAVPR